MRFFERIPIITYNGLQMRNILLKTKILREVLDAKDAYYPYLVQDGERPDTIAHDYYGDSNYDWVVLFSNDIVDPYYTWPLEHRDLILHLQKKYGATITTVQSSIKHYAYTGIGGNIETEEDVARRSWTIPPETWSHLTAAEKSGWSPVYVYDWEVERNDARRNIRLLDRIYLKQVREELKTVFDG